MSRVFSVSSPAMPSLMGGPALEFMSLKGQESLSELFEYHIQLITPDNPRITSTVAANVPYKELVGKQFTVAMELDGGGTRHLTGIVTRARFVQSQNRRGLYEVIMEPWLTLAQRTSDFKIFQNQSAIAIVRDVLGEYGYPLENRTSMIYPTLDYQVQYGESDFAFVSRLMAEWGIYYYFEHGDGVHRMVVVDAAGAHKESPSLVYQKIAYYPPGHKTDEEHADQFETSEGLQTGQWVTQEFDFRAPRANWKQTIPMPRNTGHADFEQFSWPSDAINANASEPDKDGQANIARHLTRVRMEEAGGKGQRAYGAGNLRGMVTGQTFALTGHPHHQCNGSYLILSNSLDLSETSNTSGDSQFHCRSYFTVQQANHIFRATYPQDEYGRALKPRTHGPQTAIVTGPPGREIHTDQYGRVKVSFHWNRYCPKNQNSSCWVRVASPWAGNKFGGISIPRVGQEVIVDFENGDPDRPLIIGRVYNRLNMPPWELPANQTQSGMLTRSTEEGGVANANALRFEDMKGKEEVWLHAEKDQRIEVENNESHWVGHDRNKTIDNDETNHIKNDRTETVDGHEKITVHKTRVEEVDGNESLTVHSNRTRMVDGSETETIGKTKTETIALAHMQNVGLGKMVNVGGVYDINVGGLMATVVGAARKDATALSHSVNVGKSFTLEAGDQIELKVGQSVLVMKADGTITLNGMKFELEAPDKVNIISKDIDLN